ncbi:MAG: hypothetical protein Q4F00_02325 [bacterium]|nr:hypothetical protein [bacterium]
MSKPSKTSQTKSAAPNKNVNKANSAADAKQRQAELQSQKVLSVVGFAAFGLLVGFLWGANHMIAQVSETSPLCQAVKVGALIATNTADWGRGGYMGFMGLLIGGSFGSALFWARKA